MKSLICRVDELHHHIEVFLRENPGWENKYVWTTDKGIYAVNLVEEVELKTIFEVRKNNS